jgi:hypothetical protein
MAHYPEAKVRAQAVRIWLHGLARRLVPWLVPALIVVACQFLAERGYLHAFFPPHPRSLRPEFDWANPESCSNTYVRARSALHWAFLSAVRLVWAWVC